MSLSSPDEDPFDSLLTLEDTFYSDAYALGVSDGAQAGRIEGRIFGLEKGFEKFAELGELHGRSVVWASRLLQGQDSQATQEHPPDPNPTNSTTPTIAAPLFRLPPFPIAPTPRLNTNTLLLHALTDPSTFDTSNNETAVADFDDRFRRAGAKCKVIERMVGEAQQGSVIGEREGGNEEKEKEKEDEGQGAAKGRGRATGRGDASMEDFAGSRLIR